MPFTVSEFRDLVQLLKTMPEWKEELRRLILTDELLALPASVERLEEKVDELGGMADELGGQMVELGKKVGRLDARTVRLEEKTDRLEQKTDRLEEKTDELGRKVDKLDSRLERVEGDVGTLKGWGLEARYRENPGSFFRALLRSPRKTRDLDKILEDAVDHGLLAATEADEILRADLVLQGLDRQSGALRYLVVEISWGVGETDVERAKRRATLLSRVPRMDSLAAVAGHWIGPAARGRARHLGVCCVIDGIVDGSE
ncbi:MAG: hypothetical protein HYV63_13555 [Candidatus Schekmanbacteria bacterium]|nr:hypothetical protein [Candidatus Schekmanbacteria bacterium]